MKDLVDIKPETTRVSIRTNKTRGTVHIQFAEICGWIELLPDNADNFAALIKTAAEQVRKAVKCSNRYQN